MSTQTSAGYRFSVGPWNLSDGADPFGRPVRAGIELGEKLNMFQRMGFHAVMMHDDDIVPELVSLSHEQSLARARELRRVIEGEGLFVEVFAPRLWEDPVWADGGYTAQDAGTRRAAIERSRRAIDIGREVGCSLMVFWLAREGTYLREAKDAVEANQRIVEAVDACLAYDKNVRIAIEPKPNEPMDLSYVPTIGHALAVAAMSSDPKRVGALVESAHAVLAGLDPSDEMAFALSAGKLWSVHLNDQNGPKYDQDRSFASVNLRAAFNQVRVLEEAKYASFGCVAFDTKPLRTSGAGQINRHLINSRQMFTELVHRYRSLDLELVKKLRAERDYEALDMVINKCLMRF